MTSHKATHESNAVQHPQRLLQKTDAAFLSVLRAYSVPGEVDADDRFADPRAQIAWDAFRVGREDVPLEQLPGKSQGNEP